MKNKKMLMAVGILIALLLVATVTSVIIESRNDKITLSFVGDIMLSRHVGEQIKEVNDVNFPFQKVASHLRKADIAFGNLETQISDKEGIDWRPCCKFKAEERTAKGIVYSGIDIVSVANNHALDFGPEVYDDTLRILEENGIKHVGADREGDRSSELVIIETKGKKIGYLAYYDRIIDDKYVGRNYWMPQPVVLDEKIFWQDIENADKQVDVLVVSVHWGDEYSKTHNARQEMLAHLAVDSGADIIAGHSTHMVQEIEVYRGKIIAYGLGNFVFDQPTSKTPVTNGVRDSVILDVIIEDDSMSYSTSPVKINNHYQPVIR